MIALSKRQFQSEFLLTFSVSSLAVFSLGFLLSRAVFEPGLTLYLTTALSLATLLLVVIGIGRIRRNLQIVDALHMRLRQFTKVADEVEITPLLNGGVIADGWNRLVTQFNTLKLDQGIDKRLKQVATDRGTERYARAMRSLSEGLAITDQHGCISYANPAWLSLVAGSTYDKQEVAGGSLAEIFAACDFSNWLTVTPHLLDGTKPARFELRRGQKIADGVLQLSRLPLEGRVQENEGYVWTLRDVTQNSLANLAHEQFLASASHELRTPIANIKAYSESLIDIDNIAPAQQREFFNVIHSEAERLNRLLNELLDIQQLEAGSMTINTATFEVQRMLQEIQEHIAPLVAKKQLKLLCRIAPDIKSIRADKEKIISCLVNLLGNAIKYTPQQGEIRLIAEQQESAVMISVEDNGIGIAEEEQAKIFDRFYRCQDARVSDIEGNGLGLAFALEVARLHQGDLKVQSKLNQGSRFTLRLPVSNPS